MAHNIFQTAINERRCGELLDCLFDGGTATVDARTRQLVIIPASAMAALNGDQAETPQPRVLLRGRLSAFDSGDGLQELLLTVRGEWLPEDRRVSLGKKAGTRVVVIEDTETPAELVPDCEECRGYFERHAHALARRTFADTGERLGWREMALHMQQRHAEHSARGPVHVEAETLNLCRVCGEVPAPGGACGACLAAINEPSILVGQTVEHVELGRCVVVELGPSAELPLPDMACVDLGPGDGNERTEMWVRLTDLHHTEEGGQ